MCQREYILCLDGQMLRQNCSAGLLFNPKTLQCDYADKCAQENGQKQSNPPPNGSPHYPAPAHPPVVPELVQPAQPVDHYPPSPSPFFSAPAPLPSFSCLGKLDGYYLRRSCQPNFVVCSHGMAFQHHCPNGLVFDTNVGRCEYSFLCQSNSDQQQQTTAQSTPYGPQSPPVTPLGQPTPSPMPAPPPLPPVLPTSKFKCQGLVDGYYYRRACSPHFYTCLRGQPTQLTCPGNLVFDPHKSLCQYPEACGGGGQPNATAGEPESGPSVPQPPPPRVDFSCEGRRNGYYVRRTCAQHFFTCLSGQATKVSCPGALVFEVKSASCQYRQICEAAAAAADYGEQGKETAEEHRQSSQPSAPTSPIPARNSQPFQPPSAPADHNNQSCSDCARGGPIPAATTGANANVPPPATSPIQSPLPARPSSGPSAPVHSRIPSTPPTYPGPAYGSPPSQQIAPTPLYGGPPSLPPHQNGGGQQLPPRPANLPTPVIQPPSADNFCSRASGRGKGMHADGCSSRVYACSAEGAITARLNCPQGLVFNEQNGRCEPPEQVEACGGKGRNETGTGTSPVQHHRPPPPYEAGNNGSAGGGGKDHHGGQQSPSEFECAHRAVGYYSNGCSSGYFACIGLFIYPMECPQGLRFSQQTARCDYPANVRECGAPTAIVSPPSSAGADQPQPAPPAPVPAAGSADVPAHPKQPLHVPPEGSQPVAPIPPISSQSPPAQTPKPVAPLSPSPAQQNDSQKQTGSNPCADLPDGAYGPPCSRYYMICLNRIAHDYLCQIGHVYHAAQKKCIPQQQSNCGRPTANADEPKYP